MKFVGVGEAKTNLSQLIEAVERGETVTITRHGKPVARVVPVESERKMTMDEIREGFRQVREAQAPGGPSIRELIGEGRR